MKNKIKLGKYGAFALFCLFSFIAGGVNGLLGTGGGIIFVYMLSLLTDNDPKDNFATTLCATLPISAVSAVIYFRNSNVDTELISRLALPAIMGGVLGAFLVDKINKKWLNVIFAVLVIYSGICMIFK